MRVATIQILDDLGAILGTLEVGNSSDFGLKITKTLASLQDISKRSATYSLEFEVPDTTNNQKLLFGAANVNASGDSRDVLGQRRAVILVDGNQIDKGYVYCTDYVQEESFKLYFKGGNNEWLELIGDLELNQMLWRDYTTGNYSVDALERFSAARITALSANVIYNPTTNDLTYPFVNRNNGSATEDRRPMIHFKSFWLSLQEYTGFEFIGGFLNTDEFIIGGTMVDAFGNDYEHIGLGIDPPFKFTIDDADIQASKAEYGVPVSVVDAEWLPFTGGEPVNMQSNCSDDRTIFGSVGDLPGDNEQRRLHSFFNFFQTEAQDDNVLFDVPNSAYTVATSGVYEVTAGFRIVFEYYDDLVFAAGGLGWQLKSSQIGTLNSFVFNAPDIKIHFVKNNTLENAINGTIITSVTAQNLGVVGSNYYLNAELFQNPVTPIFLQAGDTVTVFVELMTNAFVGEISYAFLQTDAGTYWRARITDGSTLNFQLKQQITLGNDFRINSHIPKGLKVLDLIKDFKTKFNLYFECDPNRKTVLIETRDNFFAPVSQAVDFTDKLDLSEPPVIGLNTDYHKILTFAHRKDASNKLLRRWEKTFKREYGDYSHSFESQNRFEKGEDSYTTAIFATAHQSKTNEKTIITSVIKEEYDTAKNAALPIFDDYNPLLLQIVRGIQYDKTNVRRLNTASANVTVAIAEPYGNVPTYDNKKLTFAGVRGLVYDYYLKTLASIDDFVTVQAEFKLNTFDVINLDMKVPIYLSQPYNLKGYYIIEKVQNFDCTKEGLTTLILQKTKDYTPAAFDSTQGTNVDETLNTIEDNSPKALLFDWSGLILEVRDSNGNKMYNI